VRDPLSTVWRRRFNRGLTHPKPKADLAAQLASCPILTVAIDTTEGRSSSTRLRVTAERLATLPSARLACLNVLKLGRVTIDRTLDEEGNNKHIDRMVALKHWASPLKLDEDRLTVHVSKHRSASAILDRRSQSCRPYRDRRARVRWCARCSAAFPPRWRRKRRVA
jgi:hypothetical protein